MKKYLLLSLCALIISMITSCEKDYIKTDPESQNTSQSDTVEVNEDPVDYTWDSTDVTYIIMNGQSITIDGDGAIDSSGIALIKSSGVFCLSGSLTNGQIIVNTTDNETVKLIFNGINITSSVSAPVYIADAKKVIIFLADNTQNYLTDGTSYQNLVDGEPNAALFSKSDLTIYGNGTLTVDGNYCDGISSKDGLIITSGNITVSSIDDGIRGKDYLIIHDGNISVNSGGDALMSDNETDASSGYIIIETGTFELTSSGDAITAVTNITIADGEYTLTTGGGSSKTSSYVSAKGIKGAEEVVVNGGKFTMSSADDAIHSNGSVEINGGTFILSSADDGIHADASITLNNCDIDITKSYEAIESASITVNNSNISLMASNDGFNATKGLVAGGTESNDGSKLTINSGNIVVNVTSGDAIDSNGDIAIAGGTILGHGPSSQPEVGMDYNGSCVITGGLLIVSGPSSNMVQSPSTSSTQYCVIIFFSSSLSANSIVHIEDASGNNIATFAPVRSYQSITLSSPNLTKGSTYTIYTGGTCTGTLTDGLYSGGTYSGGTSYSSFTISSIITKVGSSSSSGGSGPGFR